MTTVSDVIREAFDEARKASLETFEKMGGDGYACGFAWVEVKIRRNSKLGKELIAHGFRPSYRSGMIDIWNPGGLNVQSIDIKEDGAYAFARVLKEKLGISAYAGSRLD
jgi:hypothetical protein